MGIRNTFDKRTGHTNAPVIDQALGSAYKIVKSVADKLPIITYLELNIDSFISDIQTSEAAALTAEQTAIAQAAAALASQLAAAASAQSAADRAAAALASQGAAATSESNAAASEQAAKASQDAAAQSAADLAAAVAAAQGSQSAAADSAKASADSAAAALASQEGASASQTAASQSAGDAVTAKVAAETAESNAATSEQHSKTSETNAAASAAAALASQQAAATSEGNAKTSETNSAGSAQSAATSLSTVQGILQTMNALYLGKKTADPTVDNNGNPLAVGAEYFNSTNNLMRVYTSSGWQDQDQTAETMASNATASASAAAGSASAALASQQAAKTSETNSKTSETNSAASAAATLASQQAAKTSETNSKTSETNSKTSETNSKTSETNSAQSASAAASSAAAAAQSASALGGELQLTVTGGTITLTSDQVANSIYKISGALTSNAVIVFPASAKTFAVQNLTTGTYSLSIQAAGQTPAVQVVQGKSATMFTDATGCYGISAAPGVSWGNTFSYAGAKTLDISHLGAEVTQTAPSVTTFPKASTFPAGSGFGFRNGYTGTGVQIALQPGDTASDLTFPYTTQPRDSMFWFSDGVSQWILGWFSNKSSVLVDSLSLTSGGGGGITFPDGTKQTTATAGTAPTVSTYSVPLGNVAEGASSIVTGGFTAPFATIWRNGAKLTINVDYTLNADGKTINFTNGYTVRGADFFEVQTGFTYNPSTVYVPASTLVTPVFGATGISTITYTPGYVRLYRNGVRLVPTTDFTATDGQNINFVGFAGDGQTQYEVEVLTPITYGDTVRASNPVMHAPVTFPDGTQQGSSSAGKNRIINGSFMVSQRNLAANADTGWMYGAPDRWLTFCQGTGGTVQTSVATYGYNGASLNWGMTTVTKAPTNAFTGTNMIVPFAQRIEAINLYTLVGAPISISFKFRASVAGLYPVSLVCFDGNGNQSGFYHTSFQYTTAGAVQVVTLLVPAIPYAIAATNSTGVNLTIGSINTGQYQCAAGAVNTWTAYSSGYVGGYSVPGSVNWATAVNNYVMVTDVQLEAGSVATPFERRSYGHELSLCKRYYTSGSFRGSYVQTNYIGGVVRFGVDMRAAPTMTYTDANGTPNVVSSSVDGNGRTVSAGNPVAGPATWGFNVDAIINNTSSTNTWCVFGWTASAEL